jgi:hypothetical protein
MLTYAIRRSGIGCLNLFPATSSDLDLLELGRRQVRQRRVRLGGRLRERRLFGGRQLGGWSCRDYPALEDSSRVADPGAGVVEAGVSWRSAALAALTKSKSVSAQVKRSKYLLCNQRQTYSIDFFLMALFIRTACRGISVVGGGVSPANGAVPATAMVTAAVADGVVSSFSGSAREEEAEGLQEDIVSTT